MPCPFFFLEQKLRWIVCSLLRSMGELENVHWKALGWRWIRRRIRNKFGLEPLFGMRRFTSTCRWPSSRRRAPRRRCGCGRAGAVSASAGGIRRPGRGRLSPKDLCRVKKKQTKRTSSEPMAASSTCLKGSMEETFAFFYQDAQFIRFQRKFHYCFKVDSVFFRWNCKKNTRQGTGEVFKIQYVSRRFYCL